MRAGNITVYYDGQDNMGCHFVFTGQGCRQFESVSKDHGWYSLLHAVRAAKGNITRLDLAVDNIDGALTLQPVESAIITNSVQMRFRRSNKYEELPVHGRPAGGKTIYVGSPQSKVKIRFYDKAAEQASKLGVPAEDLGHWVRAEIQLMAERAQEAVKHLLRGKGVGPLTLAIFNSYFRPCCNESKNKSQCRTQEWWSNWLGATEKLRLSLARAMKYVQETMDYVRRQYSATFAMIKQHLGVAMFRDFVDEMIYEGTDKMTKRHEQILEISKLCYSDPLPF